jgi:hypothetical protein
MVATGGTLMPTIWRKGDEGWRPLAPSGYPNEKALHDLVAEAPSVLPISGSPRLTLIGREVPLGSGFADLVAVEEGGRPVVIEIKLRANSEARRAVVAQVLAYAATLYGMEPEELARVSRTADIAAAVASEDQTGYFDADGFSANLASYLRSGEFRVVVVLDDAPEDLIQIARYLSDVSDRLLVDVLTVHQFSVGSGEDAEVLLVPERIDLDRSAATKMSPVARVRSETAGVLVPGTDAFVAKVADAPEPDRARLRRLVEWAKQLEASGMVTLDTWLGPSQTTLLPRLKDEKVGLATIYYPGASNLSLWRSVFERRAPVSLSIVEKLMAPKPLGQGTSAEVSDEMLLALIRAYEEATGS